MKKTIATLLLSILVLSLLLCSCDLNLKKEEEDPIIKKTEIRQNDDSVTVVYEDGYELTYLLTQPIESYKEEDGTLGARAIGSVFGYYQISGGSIDITSGDTIVAGTGGVHFEGNGNGGYIVSGDAFLGNVDMSGASMQVGSANNFFVLDGKKYEDCATELLGVFRSKTTLLDLATGYEKEPFTTVAGFTKFEQLESVILPTSIKKVRKNAFEGCTKLTIVYYCGTAQEWEGVELVGTEVIKDKETVDFTPNLLESCTVYFYSEEEPTSAGNYWHLVDGKPTAW